LGSVIEKADFRSPSSSGWRYRSFCSGVPARARISEFPERGERRRAQDLVHEAELDLAEALPAQLLVEVRGPQPALLDLLAQRLHGAHHLVPLELVDESLERLDLLADERPHPVQMLLELGLG
jgi:hypothetical protein